MNVEALQELIALYCNVLHLFKKNRKLDKYCAYVQR